MPHQQARAYTISSSSLASPSSVHCTMTVLDEEKPAAPPAISALLGSSASRRLQGVCTNHILRLTPGSAVRAVIKPSTFRLPSDVSKPIIMIGPGTGIAPMRAFLQERSLQRKQLGESAVGPSTLFFGCRKSGEDYIYREELEGYQRDGTLTALHLAFSRDGPQKVYVQHRIAEQADALWQQISAAGAYIYVCGATTMGHDVGAALEAIFQSKGGLTQAEAKKMMAALQDSGRYCAELWSA